MLELRGYRDFETVSDDEGETEMVYVSSTTVLGKKLRARFVHGPRLNIGNVKEIINDFVTQGVQHGVIVYKGMPTSQGKKMLQNLDGTGVMRVETFPMVFFKNHLPIHRLIRPHTRLKKKDADAVRKEYGSKLPLMTTSDPVSRYYDFRGGDIIKILRRGNVIAYRLVK